MTPKSRKQTHLVFGVVLMLTILATANAAESTTNVWRSAYWGMTESQVLAAFPEAHRIKAKDVGKNLMAGRPVSVGSSTVALEKVEIAGENWTVNFAFSKTGTLSGIVISHGILGCVPLFSKVDSLLTAKYGQPFYTSSSSDTDANLKRIWKTSNTQIDLWVRSGVAGPSGVSIAYTPISASDNL